MGLDSPRRGGADENAAQVFELRHRDLQQFTARTENFYKAPRNIPAEEKIPKTTSESTGEGLEKKRSAALG